METSEKLMQSLNETWEEKMLRTHEVQKEREKALEELGITVEKNLVGVHTPKKVRVLGLSCDFWVRTDFLTDATFGQLGMSSNILQF